MPKRLTTEQFIKDCIKTHGGGRYSYDRTVYVSIYEKVEIYCDKCKEYFWQEAHSHRRGFGCNQCGINRTARKKTLTTKQFISDAKKAHGDFYDYSKTVYKADRWKVEIFCPTCQCYFRQVASDHKQGHGCTNCRRNAFSPTEYGNAHHEATLYVIHMWGMDENFYKIGITSKSISERFRYLKNYQYEVLYEGSFSGYDARMLEIKLHSSHKKYRYNPYEKFYGYTECFNHVDFDLIRTLKNT